MIAMTEFSEEVAQEHPECSDSILVLLESGRCIATTKNSNPSVVVTDEADDMKGISDALQHIDEKEEYYRYHDNPDTFVTGRLIFGSKDKEKEEYYRYHENPASFVTGRPFFGGKDKDKEEYYRYHENPETFVAGRSIFGGTAKEKEEYYRYHDNPEPFVTGRSFFGGKEKEEYYCYHNNPKEDATEVKG